MAKRKATARRRPTAAKRAGAPKRRAAARKAATRKAARKAAGRGRPALKRTAAKQAKRTAKAARTAAKAASRRRATKTKKVATSAGRAGKPAARVATPKGAAARVGSRTRKPQAKPTAAPKRVVSNVPAATGGSRSKAQVKRKQALGLDRERRIVRDDDGISSPTLPSSLGLDRSASAVRTGRQELLERYENHTETGPALTGGDVDGDWESAYSVGDEAPGGDNPTPDQSVVDDIGLAMGNQYDDDQELEGVDKIDERDRHRWEYDPASSEDFEDR